LPSATLGKEVFAECHDHGTRQSWEAETQFPSFAECQSHGTRQRFFLKKSLLSVRDAALGKVFKNKNKKKFFAKCKTVALDKEFSKKKKKFFAECR
jgi:hypothetical protein